MKWYLGECEQHAYRWLIDQAPEYALWEMVQGGPLRFDLSGWSIDKTHFPAVTFNSLEEAREWQAERNRTHLEIYSEEEHAIQRLLSEA